MSLQNGLMHIKKKIIKILKGMPTPCKVDNVLAMSDERVA